MLAEREASVYQAVRGALLSTKRYQVFVSSTSIDLAEQRRAVIDALLEASYIPVGMELFVAATEAAWPTVQRLINECDYYVVIVAGRYGSLRPNGVSFTESEYDYAKKRAKRRLAFLRPDEAVEVLPRNMTEVTRAGVAKIRRFREKLKTDLLCKYWNTGDELARRVVAGLNSETQLHPQAGWVRSDSLDNVPSEIRTGIIQPSALLGISRISPNGQAGPAMDQHIADARAIATVSCPQVQLAW